MCRPVFWFLQKRSFRITATSFRRNDRVQRDSYGDLTPHPFFQSRKPTKELFSFDVVRRFSMADARTNGSSTLPVRLAPKETLGTGRRSARLGNAFIWEIVSPKNKQNNNSVTVRYGGHPTRRNINLKL